MPTRWCFTKNYNLLMCGEHREKIIGLGTPSALYWVLKLKKKSNCFLHVIFSISLIYRDFGVPHGRRSRFCYRTYKYGRMTQKLDFSIFGLWFMELGPWAKQSEFGIFLVNFGYFSAAMPQRAEEWSRVVGGLRLVWAPRVVDNIRKNWAGAALSTHYGASKLAKKRKMFRFF